jgi:hypothetical protein
MAVCSLFSVRDGDVWSASRSSCFTPLGTHWIVTGHSTVGLHALYKRNLPTLQGTEPKSPVYPTCVLVTIQISFRFLQTEDRPFYKACWLNTINRVLHYKAVRNHVYRKVNSAVFKMCFSKCWGWAGDFQGLQKAILLTLKLVIIRAVIDWTALLFCCTSLCIISARWICI